MKRLRNWVFFLSLGLCIVFVHGVEFAETLEDLEDFVSDINNFAHGDKDSDYIVYKGLKLLDKSITLYNNGEQMDEMPFLQDAMEKTYYIKRQLTAAPTRSNEGEPCNFVGKEKFNETLQDVCQGLSCHPLEANCSGTILQFSPHVNNTVPSYDRMIATTCNITKLRCFSAKSNNGIFYDLEQTYGSKRCVVEKTLCLIGNRYIVYSPSEVGNQRLVATDACHVQLICEDHRRYGFEFFGFQCIQQELMCDGKVVPPAQAGNHSDLNRCSIRERTCTEKEWSSSGCYNYELACNKSPLKNGCIYNKIEVQGCDAKGLPNCKISEMTCNGKTLQNPTNYSGSLDDCRVSKLSCINGAKTVDLGQLGYSNCSVDQISCGKSGTADLSSCLVKKLNCGNATNCSVLETACSGAPNCSITYWLRPCLREDTCYVKQNTSWCICPLDRQGDTCDIPRPIVCDLKLETPECNVEKSQLSKSEKLLDADWPCHKLDLDQGMKMGYNLDCSFEDPVGNATEEMIAANFTYFVLNDKFAISEPVVWKMMFKFFNFRKLSDTGGISTYELDRKQMGGNELIWFNITSLAQIPERYWVGNRLYLEVGWDYDDESPHTVRVLDRRYIDSTTPRITYSSTKFSNGLGYGVILGIVIAIILALIAGYYLLKRFVFVRRV